MTVRCRSEAGMGIISRITGGRGEAAALADADKELAKHAREIAQAAAELESARLAHGARMEAGADDTEIDAAARAVTLAERRIRRAGIRQDVLAAHRTEAFKRMRAELQSRLVTAAIAAGAVHLDWARKAAHSAASYQAAKYAVGEAGFHAAALELPDIPITILDLSNSAGPTATANPIHDGVERFAFLIEGLHARKVGV